MVDQIKDTSQKIIVLFYNTLEMLVKSAASN